MYSKEYNSYIAECGRYSKQIQQTHFLEIKEKLTSAFIKYKNKIFNNTMQSLSSFSVKKYLASKNSIKLIFKFAIHMQSIRDSEEFNKNIEVLNELLNHLANNNHDAVIEVYNRELSEKDWQSANVFFTEHSLERFAGFKQDLMYSYIRPGTEIFRRTTELGLGSYGRTKLGINLPASTTSIAIKTQKARKYANYSIENKKQLLIKLLGHPESYSKIINFIKQHREEKGESLLELDDIKLSNDEVDAVLSEFVWLKKMRIESAVNLDLGIADSELIIRRDDANYVYKVYQAMLNLGEKAQVYFTQHNSSTLDRFDYCIDALLKVISFHNGTASSSGKRYAHLDVKPGNFLIDSNGKLHLIDFSFTTHANLDVSHTAKHGTLPYLPISFDKDNAQNECRSLNKDKIEITPSLYFDDKIATFRTIYNPLLDSGFLCKEEYQSIPKHIKDLLETHDMGDCITHENIRTLEFIAAVLITFRNDIKACNEACVKKLSSDLIEQMRIIREYEQNKKYVLDADIETLKHLILNNRVNLRDLPSGYKIDYNMRPEFLSFLLQNNLIQGEQILSAARNLLSILENGDLSYTIITTIINNHDLICAFFTDTREQKINLFAEKISTTDYLKPEEWTYLCHQAFTCYKYSQLLLKKADFNEVLTKLITETLNTKNNPRDNEQQNFCYKICAITFPIHIDKSSAIKILTDEKSSSLEAIARKDLGLHRFIILRNLERLCDESLSLLMSDPATDENAIQYLDGMKILSMYILLKIKTNAYLEGSINSITLEKNFKIINAQFGGDINKQIKSHLNIIMQAISQLNSAPVAASTSQDSVFGIAIDPIRYRTTDAKTTENSTSKLAL